MGDLAHQCWAELGGGWVLVGDEDNPLIEAQLLRDELRARGVNSEVRARRVARARISQDAGTDDA